MHATEHGKELSLNVTMAADQLHIESPLLPGGNIVSALFDREVMGLADRGGASNLVGARWADIAAAHAATWVDEFRSIHATDGRLVPIVRVDRLDDTPRIAAVASKRGLQNPDLLLFGEAAGSMVVQAADAKFSIETARAKQVSADVVQGLLSLRQELPDLFRGIGSDLTIEPGVFLSPDYPLTHLMLRGRYGIVRTTVHADDVILVPVEAAAFWTPVDASSVMPSLAAIDHLPVGIDQSLLVGLYYFRLSRAAVGCWIDATKPLLLHEDAPRVDTGAVRAEVETRALAVDSAIELILRWNAEVDAVRRQRAAVEQVAGLPIAGRELRDMVARFAVDGAAEAPSSSQVRRHLGSWYKGEIRRRVGPIEPPVQDLPAVLRQVAAAGRDVAPQLERRVEEIVRRLQADRDDVVPA